MNQAIEQQAIELRQAGMSYDNIRMTTGLTDYKIKSLTRGVLKVKPIETPFAKAVERTFVLAVRPHGIRDYELNDILYREYGSTWDTTTGRYVSNYDSDHKKRVKANVRLRAAQEDCDVLFVMDWVDEEAPSAGREFLEAAAKDLICRTEYYTQQYMERHATRWTEDSEEADAAQRKQLYAAKHHLLKMAVKGYGNEPLAVLLERSLVLTDLLEGTPDVPMTSGTGGWGDETPEYYPEPSRNDPFLDHVESQGWLKEVEDRFV